MFPAVYPKISRKTGPGIPYRNGSACKALLKCAKGAKPRKEGAHKRESWGKVHENPLCHYVYIVHNDILIDID
jgi:hypothetical protein